MKKLAKVLATVVVSSALFGAAAFGQEFWTVDENGPAVLEGGVIIGFANGLYKIDPISGLNGWYYPLGQSMPGDVLLLNTPGNIPSDLLRFDGSGVFFFSQIEPGETVPAKADVPDLPPAQNPVVLPEGNNGTLYIPAGGMPGFDLTGLLPFQYDFISTVPEPGSAVLMCAAAGLLGVTLLQRRANLLRRQKIPMWQKRSYLR